MALALTGTARIRWMPCFGIGGALDAGADLDDALRLGAIGGAVNRRPLRDVFRRRRAVGVRDRSSRPQ